MKSKIITLACKEGRHILRDRRSLAIVFLLPVMMVLLYGYAINLDVKDIRVAVVDYDHSALSRHTLEVMEGSGYFRAVAHAPDVRQAGEFIYSREAKAILVFPRRFERDAARPGGAEVQLLLDGSDSNTGAIAASYLTMILAGLNELPAAAGGLIEVRPRILYNPELKSGDFVVPGLAAIILMMICALMTSVTIAREKESGTLEQILTSPIGASQILLGKVLPYLAIAYIEFLLLVSFAWFWFGVPMRGSLVLLLVMTTSYLYCALGIGIAISSSVRTQQVAMSMALVMTMLPSVMLSGFIFPLTSMPLALQYIGRIIPATYYIRIVRAVMLKGASFEAVWVDFAVLTGMGMLFLAIGVRKFTTRLS
ncbi:ABC transporter permease [bacterium]|nr:ABC transporter permease [bacterium]